MLAYEKTPHFPVLPAAAFGICIVVRTIKSSSRDYKHHQ
jgi:hypothetical protein